MISITHLLIVLLVVLIVFGAGRLPQVLGDLGKGLKNFRNELKGSEKTKKKGK